MPPKQARLPPDVNRAIYVKNLPFKISAEEVFDLFGKYGPIRQIRVGNRADTRGRAYVVYEDIHDAKNAVEHLSGFAVGGRYLVVLYHSQMKKDAKKLDVEKRQAELDAVKKKYGVDSK